MQVDLFRNSPVGRLVEVSAGKSKHFAFVPSNLPTEMVFSAQTAKLLGEASYALGALNAKVSLLPNPKLLIKPTLSREAQATSAIEGTYASLADVVLIEQQANPTRDVREINNYIRAALHSFDALERLPIGRRLLEQAQAILVRGTRGEAYDSGMLRQRLVAIGQTGASLEEARYVPPPPGLELEAAFSEWEKWVNQPSSLPLIAHLALAHYQFEAVHPFSDGNGRLGRLLITLQMVTSKALDYPVLNLSEWFEARKDEYRDGLLRVSQTGDYEKWVEFFAQAVLAQANRTAESVTNVIAYRNEMLSLKSVSPAVADFVISQVGFNIAELAEAVGVAYGTARNIVEQLLKADHLTAYNKGAHRIFYAHPVEEALS